MSNLGLVLVLFASVVLGCDDNRNVPERVVRPPFDPKFIYTNGLWEGYNAELAQCNDLGEIELDRKGARRVVLLDGIGCGPNATATMKTFINTLTGKTVYVAQFRGLEGLRPQSRLSDIWYFDTKARKWIFLNAHILQNGLARHVQSLPVRLSSDLYIVRAASEKAAKSGGRGIWKQHRDFSD